MEMKNAIENVFKSAVGEYAKNILESELATGMTLADFIVKDIETSADKDYNDDDIRRGIGRVLSLIMMGVRQ